MHQISQMLTLLNLETRGHHAAADRGWLALATGKVSRAAYIEQLASVYGFEAPVEAACAYTPHLRLLVSLKQRARAGRIAQDLLSLGFRAAEVTALPQCFPMAPFTSPLEALGWMYVIERATLIHDRVRLHICAELPEAISACNYLSAYDGVAAARWSELGHVLDGTVRNRLMESTVLAAAHAGFRCLAEWQRVDVAVRRRATSHGG